MQIPPQRLVQDLLTQTASVCASKHALVVEGKPYTYGALLDGAQRLATALRARGLSRGDRVAIFMDNTFECAISIFGVLMAGGAFLVVNPQTKHDKIALLIEDCQARMLLTERHLLKQAELAMAACGGLSAILCVGQANPDRTPPMESFWDVLEANEPLAAPVGTIPLDLASLVYTSGSTGNPKGAMMTHENMVFIVGSVLEYLRLSESDRILNALPFSFGYGLYQLLMSVALGATLVLERSFTYPAKIIQRMLEQEVTVFPAVPTIYAMLIGMHERSPLSFPRVTRITTAAAALPAHFIGPLREIFPNALLFKMYGQTECKRVAYLEPELVDSHPTSVGKAIPGTEVCVLDADGQPVPPGEAGILHVRGPHVMVGYWNAPEKTNEVLKPGRLPGERLLCTNDWFKQDADGFLYFVARSDDIIKTRGEKVSPVEVENALHGMPGVREAAVIGIPDALLGSAIRAYVALEPDAAVDEREIKRYCLAHLENFMVPKEVVFLPELPKTSSGKVTKKALREAAEAELTSGTTADPPGGGR